MKRQHLIMVALFLIGAIAITACGQAAAPSPTPIPDTPTSVPPTATLTLTPDPCSQENIEIEIKAMNRMMREFDDSFAVAANTGQGELGAAVAELQRIRRDAEDYEVPSCLLPLKDLQLVHMNTVIQTMLAFMSGSDQERVNQGITLSRQLHQQYMIEMARLLGTTALALPTPIPTEGTGTPEGTAEPTPNVPIVTNPGPAGVNIRSGPSLDSQDMGTLELYQSALALGISPDGFWIMIEIPGQAGQVGWVYSALVELRGASALPVVDNTAQ